MCKKRLGLAVLCVMLMGELISARAAAVTATGALPQKLGVRRGICVVLGDVKGRLAVDIARESELIVFLQLRRGADVAAACKAADDAGLYGKRVYVAKGDLKRIQLADNVADGLIAVGDSADVAKAEVLRVLRPGGQGIVGRNVWTKPPPAGADDWSHFYHGPDNNPQSRDRLARSPYLTQFMAVPRYGPAPQAAVSAGGRVFIAFGHVAWHQREEPWLNTLVAVNGYNGTMLWRRPLPPGIMVDRNTMIATAQTLYLADHKSCKLIDAATGKVTGEIAAPADLTGGTFWKWTALSDGVLYALVGKDEPADAVARWRRKAHGWPWGGISKGYNEGQYTWGFAKTLLAMDPKTGKKRWHHREDEPIDSRGTCMAAGRIYISSFGKYIACLDAKSGRQVWRLTAGANADVFRKIGPYRPGHGYVGGWKSTVYMKCTEKAIYFIGPQVNHVTALSANDGRYLWTYPAKDMQVVIRDDALYTIGDQASRNHTRKIDPLTGKVLASYPVHRRACTRSTGGVDGLFFRAPGGSVRLDLPSGKSQWISPMRPSCHVGVVIANGHLYWVPWACDCNLQMFGVISLAPAGGFDFAAKAAEAERLEKSPAADRVAKFDCSESDWPTHRADNARTAAASVAVPQRVKLLWRAKPATPFEATSPVAAGGMVFLGGSDGIVRALDAATGLPKWTAYTGGAIRYPPTIAGGRAFVGSGDGWAYAFEAATGRRLWRFRAAPAERRIPVFGSLLSTWPVAAGVLVDGSTAYLAAGINNFDGTHVYALDAATGAIKWQNNTSGHLDRFSRRGVAVQGDLLMAGGKLYLAGGNAASPGVYDPADGKCLTPPPGGMGSRAPRGRELTLAGQRVTVTGQPFYSHPASPVYDRSTQWLKAIVTTKTARLTCQPSPGPKGPQWRLVALQRNNDTELWRQPLPAAPVRWGLAVDAAGRIIVSLRNGQVLCFGK